MTDEELREVLRPLYEPRAFEMAWPDLLMRDARAVEAAALERAMSACRHMRIQGQVAYNNGVNAAESAIRAMIPKAQGARDE